MAVLLCDLLKRRLTAFAGADAYDLVSWSDEYFAVAKFSGPGSLLDGLDDRIFNIFRDDYFDLDLWN